MHSLPLGLSQFYICTSTIIINPGRDLHPFANSLFQLNRNLQVMIQKNRAKGIIKSGDQAPFASLKIHLSGIKLSAF